jgi:putative transposase
MEQCIPAEPAEGLFKRRQKQIGGNMKSYRLKGYDYRLSGYYFITIVTFNRKHYFGEVSGGVMNLNKNGIIVQEEILNTESLRDSFAIDEYVILPNHIHFILVCDQNEYDDSHRNSGLKANSVGSVINQLKGKITKRIRSQGNNEFSWKRNYYDHIIRNQRALGKIRLYIKYNIHKWEVVNREDR